jgi:hypothetical protein
MQPSRALAIGVCLLALPLASVVAATPLPSPGAPRGASGVAGGASAEPDCGTDNLLAGKAPAEQQEITGNLSLVTDGAIGVEGTRWDAPLAVTFFSSFASLTYDLGRTRTVSALYIQADANDTYRILGSTDGAPGSFRLLTTAEDAFARGHGFASPPPSYATSASARRTETGVSRSRNSRRTARFRARFRQR